MATLSRVCDISNHQGAITPTRAKCMANDFDAVVVRLSTESQNLITIARQQIIALQNEGIQILGYPWAYFDQANHEIYDIVMRNYADLQVTAILMDCEDEQHVLSPDYNVIWLHGILEMFTDSGYASGIYSGSYYWSHYMGNDQSFGKYVSWVANPNGKQTLADVAPLGNAPVVGKQYDWYGNVCGISPLDLNVFDTNWLASIRSGGLTVEERKELEYLRSWYGLVKGDYMDNLQNQKNTIMYDGDHSQEAWAAIDETQNIIDTIRRG